MRKYTFPAIITLSLMVFSFTSCKKEGVYNPKKKISKVFTQAGTTEAKELSETWTWEKNKLTKIEYADGNQEKFEYDKNRISKITNNDGVSVQFTYDGSKTDKVEFYDGSVLYKVYKFEHDGKKVSKITIEKYDNDLKSAREPKKDNILRFILPGQSYEAINESTPQTKSRKAVETSSITLAWDGNNVKEVVSESFKDGKLFTITYNYTYDNKSNPYIGLLSLSEEAYSKNNTVTESVKSSNNASSEGEYSYTYEDNFPKDVTYVYRNGKTTRTTFIYFEYEK